MTSAKFQQSQQRNKKVEINTLENKEKLKNERNKSLNRL